MPQAGKTTPTLKQVLDRALQAGIQAARAGNKKQAQKWFTRVTELDPLCEDAWLWLASVAENKEQAITYLQTVLALNPDNRQAQEGMHVLLSSPASKEATPETEQTAQTTSLLNASGELMPRFALSVEQAEAIDRYLEKMVYESEARCIILADTSGQLVAERGQTNRMNTQVLSALAAGELAATQEMARLVGEKARFRLLLHEGEEQSVYLSDVGEQLILVIVFDVDTPIGLVRMVLKQALEELTPILLQSGPTAPPATVNKMLGDDFARLLKNELDAALNGDWTEK